jgi:hypothetical protein
MKCPKLLTLAVGALLLNPLSIYATHLYDAQETRKLAVENNCGQYAAKTGEFEWVKVESALLKVSEVLPDYKPTPAPAHKPKIKP